MSWKLNKNKDFFILKILTFIEDDPITGGQLRHFTDDVTALLIQPEPHQVQMPESASLIGPYQPDLRVVIGREKSVAVMGIHPTRHFFLEQNLVIGSFASHVVAMVMAGKEGNFYCGHLGAVLEPIHHPHPHPCYDVIIS